MKDVTLDSSLPTTLLLDMHGNYLKKYEEKKNDYDYCMVEFLRMSGVYWGLTAMDLMNKLDNMSRDEVIEYVKSCQDPKSGGFGASVGHDPHILYTLSAVQIVVLLDALDAIDTNGAVKFVCGLQQPDGSFAGDKWGETDTRLSFCAVACLALLKRLDSINVDKVVEYILSCKNFDGGFGTKPGSESHAGLIYCCVGVLSITRNLDKLDPDLLGWWLSERQLPSGGLNGRPEKLPDVCYSWWVLSSLTILGRLHWLDKKKLHSFILACQDSETGGFSDRPGDMVDPYHTLFGLAGISLLGNSSLKKVNPVFCLPQYVIDRLGIETEILSV